MKLFLPHPPSLPPPPRITYFSSNYYTKTFVNNEAIDQTIHGYFFPITPQLINKKNPIKRACHRWNNFLIAKNFFKLARNCRNYYWFLRRKYLEIKKFPGILLLLYLSPPPLPSTFNIRTKQSRLLATRKRKCGMLKREKCVRNRNERKTIRSSNSSSKIETLENLRRDT